MPNVRTIIEGNNKRKLAKGSKGNVQRECNCLGNTTCPLQGKCLSRDIVYQATVKTSEKEEKYVGLTATVFKVRYANHKASFKARAKSNSTELSKYIWQLKDSNTDYTTSWKILCHASHYTNVRKRCNLCIAEKYYIICQPQSAILNKCNELISKCRHNEQFLLKNVK